MVCAAAQNTDVRQREEGDEQAVDALRTRQKLKNKDFTEQRGIFRNDACGCLTGHAYADGGTDAAEKCCQNCADKRENNAERVDIELIHVTFPP